jgi:alkylation response protein AidB-like acyl-CoA dehydrogenase
MDFNLTEEHKMIRDMARDFAQKELAPNAAKWDQESHFPAEAVKKMAELGLMGITAPVDLGGAGMDNLSYVLVLEEIAAACASTAVTMSVNNSLYIDCILRNGSDLIRQKYIPEFAQGIKLGAYALTEPNAGSDAANLRTTAVKKGDKYILNGTKSFITNGPHADAMVVYATLDREKKHKGITAFVIEKGMQGFKVGKKEDKLGIRASSTSEIVLDNCEVPAENVLGGEGKGFYIAMSTLDGGRIGIATQALGIARAALDASAKYAREREAFGRTISEFQGIQWKIADMAMRVDASRLLIHRVAWMKDNGMKHGKEASMAKLFASETANFAAKEAVQIFGGYGYSKEYPVERYFRDAKITEIYEGTSEIQRIVIAKNVLEENKR